MRSSFSINLGLNIKMLYSEFPESILGKAMQGHTGRRLGNFVTSIPALAAGNAALQSHHEIFSLFTEKSSHLPISSLFSHVYVLNLVV